jgi:hypothetical protein
MKSQKILLAILIIASSFYSAHIFAHGGGGHGGGFGGGHGGFGGGFRGGYGGHSGFGIYLGAPYYGYGGYGGYGYGYPYYSAPAVVPVPTTPPVYIQQAPVAAQQNPSGYWYYCTNPEGYYPYIKACPNGWQQVEPTPPPH